MKGEEQKVETPTVQITKVKSNFSNEFTKVIYGQ